MVSINYYRVRRVASDASDKDGGKAASRKIEKRIYPEERSQI